MSTSEVAPPDVVMETAATAGAAATETAPTSVESALVDDIRKHGENAYYYAHKRNIGPTSIRAYDEPVSQSLSSKQAIMGAIPPPSMQPRLLSSTPGATPTPSPSASPLASTPTPSAGARHVPIVTYAWADNDATVKVYVELPGLDAVDNSAVQLLEPDSTTIELRVTLPTGVHVLRLGPLYAAIAGAAVKRTSKRVIITLSKAEEGKTFKWYTLLGEKRSSAAAKASPMSLAGEDFDLSGALNGVTPGLDEDF